MRRRGILTMGIRRWIYRWKWRLIIAALVAAVVALLTASTASGRRFLARCFSLIHKGRDKVVAVADFDGSVKNIRAAQLCRENLVRIENAKRKVAQDRGGIFGRLTEKDISPELPGRRMPRCPAGGSYNINNIGTLPSCSVGYNGTSSREDDHILLNY